MTAEPATTQIRTFHVPDDQKLLEVIGRVAILHGHLDYSLRMTIRDLTNTSIAEARDATVRETSSSLRDRIRKLAKAVPGDGKLLVELQALLQRAKRVTDKRNALMHQLYAKEIDGESMMVLSEADQTWVPPPTVGELEKLGREIKDVYDQLNVSGLRNWKW